MKLGTALIFAFLLVAEPPLFFCGNQTASANALQQSSDAKEKRGRKTISAEAMRRRAKNPWFRMLDAVEKTVGTRFPLYSGLVLVAAGLTLFFIRESRKHRRLSTPVPSHAKVSVPFLAILCIGAILRLYGLSEKSLDHTEMFVPRMPLPLGISAPPPRNTLADMMSFHFHIEPHPPAYYFLMWPWTKIVGTSEFMIRLPSAIFGIASIWLIYQLVSLTHTKRAALFAAALLALNGHHIFWSQMARMYALMCFLGLLSTLLLVRLAFSPARRLALEAMYVCVSVVGLFTEILFWPFLAVQAFWTGIVMRNEANTPDRVLRLQSIIIMLGTPLWAHAVYRARSSHLDEPSLSFLQSFFSFGFLLHPDPFTLQARNVPILIAIPLLFISGFLVFTAYRKRENVIPLQPANDPGVWKTLPISTGAIFTTIGISLFATSRRSDMVKAILVPIVALFIPWILAKIGWMVRWLAGRLRFDAFMNSPDMLYYFLGLLPSIGLFVLSFRFSLLGTRLFLLFVPFVLILIGISLSQWQSKKVLFVPVSVLLLVFHFFSLAHFHNALSTPVNYKGLAKEIKQRFQEGDLIFVRAKHWAVTPLFYYLEDHHDALITGEFDRAVAGRNPRKVFVIRLQELPATPQMEQGVRGLHLREVVEQRRAYADVYSR